jgi:hypothetical protein
MKLLLILDEDYDLVLSGRVLDPGRLTPLTRSADQQTYYLKCVFALIITYLTQTAISRIKEQSTNTSRQLNSYTLKHYNSYPHFNILICAGSLRVPR